ncbi:NADAR family protein [Catenulispora pinisilvae]|uniref:NADAR family protein n=1 Tax=Catenulispora pinisilvae TaxID=2705253 RepID=UPI002B2735B8|nr:NADAR family protein [Catenulispora pinisilvae]
MAIHNATWRDVDGERIVGTWRPAFIRNGRSYFLTDLLIYADGMVDCWGLETLEGFADKLASEWVVTDVPEDTRVSAHHLGSWKMADPHLSLTPEMLLGEVRDTVDDLNRRPNSTARCLAALDVFLADPTEANRDAAREAYEAIPEHLRHYALGDMDNKDHPLKALVYGVGSQIELWSGEALDVTEETLAWARDYFAEREQARQEYANKKPADGPTEPVETSILIEERIFPRGWPEDPGKMVLRNECPAPILIGDHTYPTVTHAYWALAVTDEQRRTEIRTAERAYDARKIAESSARHENWPQARVAVMTRLLRAKFQQHPDFAETLLATGATRLIYNEGGSTFWSQHGRDGRNWMGRLLELIRSELAADKLDISI